MADPLTDEKIACTAGWCCGRTCLRSDDDAIRDPSAPVCQGCVRRLLATIAALKKERDWARHERDVFSSDSLRAERDAAIAERDAHAATLERLLGCGSCVSETNAEDGCPCAHAPCIHTLNRLHRERDAAIAEMDAAYERAAKEVALIIESGNFSTEQLYVLKLACAAIRSLASDGGKSEGTVECSSCDGKGYFSKHGKPIDEKRAVRPCIDCNGTGKIDGGEGRG